MTKIGIIGAAGCIGSSITFNIVKEGLADEIVMSDIRQDWLEHHYIDIFDAKVTRGIAIDVHTGSHEHIANSDIVIMAAGVPVKDRAAMAKGNPPSRQQLLPDNLAIIREWMQTINKHCPQAVVITATNPAETLNHASYLLSIAKKRHLFIGYSLNDTIRFKIAIAQVLGVEPSKIDAMVVGEHGGSMVPLFSSVKIGGEPIVVAGDKKAAILKKMGDYLPHMLRLNIPRTSGWLTGVGIAMLVKAIVHDTGEIFPCCAVLDGEYGYQGISIGVPVALGWKGISEIIEHRLTSVEKDLLDQSVNNVQTSTNYLLEHIH